MARAAQQREQADRQAEAVRREAGRTSRRSSLTIALKAMQEAAAKDLPSADAKMSRRGCRGRRGQSRTTRTSPPQGDCRRQPPARRA